jgi:hypothetical protein
MHARLVAMFPVPDVPSRGFSPPAGTTSQSAG